MKRVIITLLVDEDRNPDDMQRIEDVLVNAEILGPGEYLKSLVVEDDEDDDDGDPIPCVRCGRIDLPLHTNYQCGECGPDSNHV